MMKKVSNILDQLQFNTCVSEFMIFANHLQSQKNINKDVLKKFIICTNPFIPHLAHELWEVVGEKSELSYETWPFYDNSLLQTDLITIPVQVNGKRRAEINVPPNADDKIVIDIAKGADKAKSFMEGKKIIKEIYVKGKIVNIVVK